MHALQGKVFVITGASGGIGAATAERAVHEGARVVMCDLDAAALNKAAEPIREFVHTSVCDVTRFGDLQRAVSIAVERFGRLDAMVANAGIEGTVAPLTLQTEEDFNKVLAVNVNGVWNNVRAAAPAMKDGGDIVITSSVAGFVGSAGLGPYVTSKHAVVGLMRTAAIDLAAQGIRVNSVHPGPIDNRMMRSIERQAAPDNPAAVKSGFEGMVPLGRYGTNEEIASMITWLCGADSSYCTGQRFVVDGGFLAK